MLPEIRQAPGATIRPDQPSSASERLAGHWQSRRQEALEAVSRALRENRLVGAHAPQLAQMVHNVAGTAGIFGESELGIRASALERALIQGDAAERISLATEFLHSA